MTNNPLKHFSFNERMVLSLLIKSCRRKKTPVAGMVQKFGVVMRIIIQWGLPQPQILLVPLWLCSFSLTITFLQPSWHKPEAREACRQLPTHTPSASSSWPAHSYLWLGGSYTEHSVNRLGVSPTSLSPSILPPTTTTPMHSEGLLPLLAPRLPRHPHIGWWSLPSTTSTLLTGSWLSRTMIKV